MKFSIILPTYNRSFLLKETLLSLINQNFDKSEYNIIVIDDNSNDNTKDIVNELINKNVDSNIVYHKNKSNKGIWYNRNLGIELAKWDVIIQTEDDAKYSKDYIEKINDEIQKCKDKDWWTFVVYPRNTWNFDEWIIPKLVEFRRKSIDILTKKGKREIIWWWIFRKDMAKNIWWYKTLKIWEDTEFVQRVKKNWYKCYAIFSTYRLHQEPNTFKKFYKRMFKQWYAYKEYKKAFNPKVTLFSKIVWLSLMIFPIFCMLLSFFIWIYWIIALVLGFLMLTFLYQETRYMYLIIRKSKYKYLLFFIMPYYLCEVYWILNGRIKKSIKEKELLIY